MIQIRDAKMQTKKEIHENLKSGNAAKFGKTRLGQDIQRTDDYLKQIAADIAKSEHDLMKNAENIQKYIDRKEKHRANFRKKMQNKQLKKFDLIKKQEKALTNYQNKMRENLRHLNSRQMKGCDNKAFKQCIRGSSSQAQACFNKAMSSYSSNQACRVEASEYLEKMAHYRDMQVKYNALYEKEKKLVEEEMAEIDAAKEDFKELIRESVAKAEMLKQEKMEKRAKFLILKQNQLKGQQFAKVLKNDLTNAADEFDSITDSLELSRVALREVQSSLQANFRALKKFEVQLNNLRGDIMGQVDNFEDFSRRMKSKKFVNPYILKSELQSVYTENMKAGVGLVVMSQMYDSIFAYMADLDECPVGLYNDELSLKDNVKRFQKFVKEMNGQRKMGLDDLDEPLKDAQAQIDELNKLREQEGLDAVNSDETIIDQMIDQRNVNVVV